MKQLFLQHLLIQNSQSPVLSLLLITFTLFVTEHLGYQDAINTFSHITDADVIEEFSYKKTVM